MQQPLTDPFLMTLHRAIADGSLTGPALHAMLIGPSPISASGRRQTRALDDSVAPAGDSGAVGEMTVS